MIDKLFDPHIWDEYYEYKTGNGLLNKRDTEYLQSYISEKRYMKYVLKIRDGEYPFSIPTKKEVNKIGTSKKRVVYIFPEDENTVLKLISYLLYEYDSSFAPNCYAFRRSVGPRKAFTDMMKKSSSELYAFKSDISNYFNSIDVQIINPILDRFIDDKEMLNLITSIISDDRCIVNGNIIHEQKGVMAGTPISPFLANVYLTEMDYEFYNRGIAYARYSDDVLIFDTKDRLDDDISLFHGYLDKYKLTTNPAKEEIFEAGTPWSFLGFEYDNGEIDLSRSAVNKLMQKIRRQSHSMRRWMIRKNVEPEKALRAFNRKFNRKFFDNENGRELCWSRWYFPLINTTESLKVIDEYMQQCERYIVTGKHNKMNYEKAPYEMLKNCGYRPLVSEYFKH